MIFENNHNNGVIYMSGLKDENYINIQGWMVTKLGLKGNALLIYAIIYGFSQDGESMYTGTQGYLADWTSSSKETIRKTLNILVEQNYIIRVIDDVNNIQFYRYKVNPDYVNPSEVLNNLDGTQENWGGAQESWWGTQENWGNNNKIYNKVYNKVK